MPLDYSRLRTLTAREIVSALLRDGFRLRRVTVSFHRPGETFGFKTLRSMLEEQARWNVAPHGRPGHTGFPSLYHPLRQMRARAVVWHDLFHARPGCDDRCYHGCDMKRRPPATTLRRSVALPTALIGELNSVAPPELRTNFNRLVILEEGGLQAALGFSQASRQEFDSAVAAMAGDPQVQAECAAIARDFAATEIDGLGND